MSDLKHEPVKIRQIIEQFSSGQLAIPEFQRGYVWKPAKAAKLLDSLYQRFPVSCLLAWESAYGVEHRDGPRPRHENVRWIIDGQQRIKTLQKIKDHDLEIVFNIDSAMFSRANAATRRDPACIRVSDIWDERAYRDLRRAA